LISFLKISCPVQTVETVKPGRGQFLKCLSHQKLPLNLSSPKNCKNILK
jgi:hypothetical protein